MPARARYWCGCSGGRQRSRDTFVTSRDAAKDVGTARVFLLFIFYFSGGRGSKQPIGNRALRRPRRRILSAPLAFMLDFPTSESGPQRQHHFREPKNKTRTNASVLVMNATFPFKRAWVFGCSGVGSFMHMFAFFLFAPDYRSGHYDVISAPSSSIWRVTHIKYPHLFLCLIYFWSLLHHCHAWLVQKHFFLCKHMLINIYFFSTFITAVKVHRFFLRKSAYRSSAYPLCTYLKHSL